MDVCESVQKWLEGEGYTASLKRLDSFTGKDGIIVRRVGQMATDHYVDRDRCLDYYVQIVVRSRDEEYAMQTCFSLADKARYASFDSLDGSYRFIGCEIYTEPQELSLDEAGFYAWDTRLGISVEHN